MTPSRGETVLLALDAGVRQSGWASFRSGQPATSGVIGMPGRRVRAAGRVDHLIQSLDQLVAKWQPDAVACTQPSGIHWPVPALQLLEQALAEWSGRQQLSLYAYTTQEVRLALTGQVNASRDRLAYEVMVRFGLIGQVKTTHEWEAIGVGGYHLARSSTEFSSSPAVPKVAPTPNSSQD